MKVLNLREIGEIGLEERDVPEPGEGEVLIEVKACGICSSDEDRIFKTGTYHFPTVPGHEFAGKIVKLGKNADEALMNSKASIFPLLPCFKCNSCRRGEYATCKNYKYFGSRNDGGFSEYLVVPEWNLNLLDDTVGYDIGALSEPAAVAHHAVEAAEVSSGETVMIIGTGTIGILIAGMCKIKGAETIIVGRRSESVRMAAAFGITSALTEEAINYAENHDIDTVFEAVGTNTSLATAIDIVRPNGRIIAVGNPKDDLKLEKNTYWKILRKQLTLKGTWNSSFKGMKDDWKVVAEMMKEKDFPFEKLITERYPLEKYEEAFERFRDKSKAKSRIMFVMNEEKTDE